MFRLYNKTTSFKACLILFAIFGAIFSLEGIAGVLVLKNMDRVEGKLTAIKPGAIVWQSTNFGKKEFPKGKVNRIETDQKFKISGQKEPCQLLWTEPETIEFKCVGGALVRVPFLSLKQLEEYKDHRKVANQLGGRLDVVGIQSSGNRRKRNWILDGRIKARFSDYRHELRMVYDSESQITSSTSTPIKEKFETNYDLDWFFSPKNFIYVDLQALSDKAKRIRERYTTGGGLGYQFWESTRSAFSLNAGVQWVTEAILVDNQPSTTDADINEFSTGVVESNYRFKLKSGINIYNKISVDQSFRNSDEWELDSETGLDLPVGKKMLVALKYEYDFDNLPPNNSQKRDSALRVGLAYKW